MKSRVVKVHFTRHHLLRYKLSTTSFPYICVLRVLHRLSLALSSSFYCFPLLLCRTENSTRVSALFLSFFFLSPTSDTRESKLALFSALITGGFNSKRQSRVGIEFSYQSASLTLPASSDSLECPANVQNKQQGKRNGGAAWRTELFSLFLSCEAAWTLIYMRRRSIRTRKARELRSLFFFSLFCPLSFYL